MKEQRRRFTGLVSESLSFAPQLFWVLRPWHTTEQRTVGPALVLAMGEKWALNRAIRHGHSTRGYVVMISHTPQIVTPPEKFRKNPDLSPATADPIRGARPRPHGLTGGNGVPEVSGTGLITGAGR
jgi:hypothetical protein